MPLQCSFPLSFSQINTELYKASNANNSLNQALTRELADRAGSGTQIKFSDFLCKDYTLPGQVEYTTAGTYTWTVPSDVYSISVVVVGGGGGSFNNDGAGGGGGALAWASNIAVNPGQNYTVVVGAGAVGAGGQSYFKSTSELRANGGLQGFSTGGAGGTYIANIGVNRGGGNGGQGGGQRSGGSGAGGYNGTGGSGGTNTPSAGSGGGGGGGATAAGGGGVGIYGQGVDGAAGSINTGNVADRGGRGGSGGERGYYFNEGRRGGAFGGGGPGDPGAGQSNRPGERGAVRIIWPGNKRQFPSTRTGNE